MSQASTGLIEAFNALPNEEQRVVAIELLKRVLDEVPAELSEDAFINSAEELFLELDSREAANSKSAGSPIVGQPDDPGHLDRVYEILSRRYSTGEGNLAERHNEHQP